MPHSSLEPLSGHDDGWSGGHVDGLRESATSRVLIVAKSQINRVVVAKIVERSGLRHQSLTPDEAVRKIATLSAELVILDAGPDNRDCDALLTALVDRRRVAENGLPRVILLSTRTGTPEGLQLGAPVDAVVAKPITPESLQPVVDRLLPRFGA